MRILVFLTFSCVAVSAFGDPPPDAPIWLWTPAQRVGVRMERLQAAGGVGIGDQPENDLQQVESVPGRAEDGGVTS